MKKILLEKKSYRYKLLPFSFSEYKYYKLVIKHEHDTYRLQNFTEPVMIGNTDRVSLPILLLYIVNEKISSN